MRSLQHNDTVFAEFLAKIDPEIADTFTDEQLDAIKEAFGSRSWNRHPIDVRVSVPIPGIPFYLVLLAGSERRSKQRLRSEKGLYPLWTPSNIIFMIGFIIVLSVSGLTTLSFVFSSLSYTYNSSPHPASIPWLENKSDCQHTGRIWEHGKCWDYEHNPMF
ncbi:hypothetical protein G7B40_034760 [Aetokthonos hydrillicola Thurmond2011]|jgi:hypothetical protein|uniref:Uncharacterized protein n=1 Tax=Aetokthonos hydrillicola Thurmond2011 TaxID=2712845 RepID=A0AAP5IGT5_9CYAN|nr:hypothetical protein [Aetokthonos hydrillicola]MBO3458095.1 hypothetical protein [Aetokthonos hydrillicola CCALA 1050]MBW4587068.1 hypothetical protein [Aetokthonos hydrillicola CCALA 1050]MDR9899683.1 hypothetical protein [Aetokthonos hydrillicola Thurmond2011]